MSFYKVGLWLLLAVSLWIAIGSCQSGADSSSTNPAIVEGQKLAEQHCSTCHLAVAPSLLDKKTWVSHVLPAMAPRLGLESYQGGLYYAGRNAVVSYDDWQKIVAYFETLAPEKFERTQPARLPVNDWAVFSLEKPRRDTTQTAETTLVAIDTIAHQLYSGDGLRSDISRWDQQLRPTKWKQLKSAPVHASFFLDRQGAEHGVFTSLGTMLAEDILKGELLDIQLSGKQPGSSTTMLASLPRPVQSVAADLDKDGLTDWVVCGFGHLAGGLYWLKQRADHTFSKQPIREVAGAIQTSVGDVNGDGWPDIIALFAHGDEGIWLFLNDKKGNFTERRLLRFPPIYGSTSFQLVDFNGDGLQDILYTCGDNSDYSQILKPYHGIYIYLNQGNFTYRKQWFHPVNGCVKAIAADFDQDGDADIASIAFYADFQRNPGEGFLYFDQTKPRQFRPHALPISTYGRWICMDVNDWDQDGDLDIVLGNFSKGFLNQADRKPTWDTHLPLIVLANKTRP